MRYLITHIVIILCINATAQKPEFKTYFDTAYWFSDEVDTVNLDTNLGIVSSFDTMPSNHYGKYSQFALKYAQSILGTKVGDGLCGRVGERMCELAHAEMKLKYRVTGLNTGAMEVGDLIVFPQFLEFYGPTGLTYASTPAEHLSMFMGMKNDSVMIVIHQNIEGNTYNTKVVIEEVNINRIRFFKGNNHQAYFDVYGYEPRRVVKKEYRSLTER